MKQHFSAGGVLVDGVSFDNLENVIKATRRELVSSSPTH